MRVLKSLMNPYSINTVQFLLVEDKKNFLSRALPRARDLLTLKTVLFVKHECVFKEYYGRASSEKIKIEREPLP